MSDDQSGKLPQGVELTPIDEAFRTDPYAILKMLRERAPLLDDRALGRFVCTRHDDVKSALHDKDFFSDPRKANPGNFSKDTLPEGKPDLHGLPPEAKGDYVGFMKKQLTELLTNYGPIDLLWCDQFINPYTGKDWQEIKAHVKSIQPACIVIANNSLDDKNTDIHSYEYPWLVAKKVKKTLPSDDNKSAAEVCDIMGPAWFWWMATTTAPTTFPWSSPAAAPA